jgi:hypothetical protein
MHSFCRLLLRSHRCNAGEWIQPHCRFIQILVRGLQPDQWHCFASETGKASLDLGTPIRTNAPVREIVMDAGKVTRVVSGDSTSKHCRRAKLGYPANPSRFVDECEGSDASQSDEGSQLFLGTNLSCRVEACLGQGDLLWQSDVPAVRGGRAPAFFISQQALRTIGRPD